MERSRLAILSTHASLAPPKSLILKVLLMSLQHLLLLHELLLARRFGLRALVQAVGGVVLGEIHLFVLAPGQLGEHSVR